MVLCLVRFEKKQSDPFTMAGFSALLVAAILSVLAPPTMGSRVRTYYVMAEEVTWDYMGGGRSNLLAPGGGGTQNHFTETGPERIGSIYKKAVYSEFSSASFTARLPPPAARGLLGPLLRAEVGDTLEVVFLNNASRAYSMHPHGVKYLKQHESAIYVDGTSGRLKEDDVVFPGQKIRMLWNVTSRDAPGDDDAACVPWVYHSHIHTEHDTSAGVMGVLVTCRPGTLDDNNRRTDVDHDYPLLVKIWDENLSWYIRDNAQRCLVPTMCLKHIDEEDEDFTTSNYMAAINGYMYGHLPGLEACAGDKIAFYVVGMGNEFDIHSLHFHGQVMDYQHTRGDTVSVFSATFVAAQMTAATPGRWLVGDMVGDNLGNGMGAFLNIHICQPNRTILRRPNAGQLEEKVPKPTITDNLEQDSQKGRTADQLRKQAPVVPVRTYFLQAEEVTWDYAPRGEDGLTGAPLTLQGTQSSIYYEKSSTRIGGVYKKAVFREYTDSSFKTRVQRPKEDAYLGILGPVLRAEAGDNIKVMVKNSLMTSSVSLLPHGVLYNVLEEQKGTDPQAGGQISPGRLHTYVWAVPSDIMGNSTDPCRNYIYSSGVHPRRDQSAGLAGPLLLCHRGYLSGTANKPKEMFLMFQTIDENLSMFIKDNMAANNVTVADNDEEFVESNLMYSINGYGFGNLPVMTSCSGDDVTWYVMALGRTEDVHTLTFHGHTFRRDGRHRDSVPLVAGSTAGLAMTLDNPGRWLVYSHSRLALQRGMYGFYAVAACAGGNVTSPSVTSSSVTSSSVTSSTVTSSSVTSSNMTSSNMTSSPVRHIYVQAEEVDWDYAPRESSVIDGRDLNDPRGASNIFFKDDENFIGDVYKKAVYREYTDGSFTKRKPIADEDLHKDILGPIIRAEIGDVIIVTFRNNATRDYSLHTHGFKTTPASSGLGYHQHQTVRSGGSTVYEWHTPARSGPGPRDPPCVPWLYYSGLDPALGGHAGLVGVAEVCRPGTLDSNGRRKDVDREFVLLMSVINENNSPYLQENIKTHAPNRVGTDWGSDPDFEESNIMHAINGRLHGNTHHLTMALGDTVAWVFAAIGAEVDIHSFHLHGHTVLQASRGHRNDAVNVFPGQAEPVTMVADNPGTWLLHCHQLDHIIAGMETVYTVNGTLGPGGWPS